MNRVNYKIGVISDTHGLLRLEAEEYLKENDLIIHAGDIVSVEIIYKLRRIASVKAIRGNIDKDNWADKFPGLLDF